MVRRFGWVVVVAAAFSPLPPNGTFVARCSDASKAKRFGFWWCLVLGCLECFLHISFLFPSCLVCLLLDLALFLIGTSGRARLFLEWCSVSFLAGSAAAAEDERSTGAGVGG